MAPAVPVREPTAGGTGNAELVCMDAGIISERGECRFNAIDTSTGDRLLCITDGAYDLISLKGILTGNIRPLNYKKSIPLDAANLIQPFRERTRFPTTLNFLFPPLHNP